MPLPHVHDRRAAAFAGVLALLGALTVMLGLRTEDALPPLPAGPAAPPATVTATPGAAPVKALKPALPVRLRIPAIGVDTTVMQLGLRRDGSLEVPPLRGDAPAGWYRGSPSPGETGASVLAGHVDTARDGPAVFFRLRELKAGDQIVVRRDDDSVATFRVSRVALYAKRDFPTAEVYAPIDRPGLRLITCGGAFDRSERSYRSNVVVFAESSR
ncbi:class F sortase [Actinoplanes philippinensis]|uniref:LPXTG-site transpeptidase (Sortase) family protein n=1 Tax=Actinoplanes philippinensis TaxID=35752 RepID=A0A1I1ZK08_9ACTN|nr:class F sortase [Actinoplanes philippinensis]GIE75433.1 class F sortase [Actinoplanes philippinensis]SFE32154.1 LPXTG-site transpeptidase (sortase) family protein [Actinoplanes philippinensis]